MARYEENGQLMKEYKKVLIEEGVTQQQIADGFGITRQSLFAFTNKKHLSFDDMKKLLAPIGYEIEFSFVKKAE